MLRIQKGKSNFYNLKLIIHTNSTTNTSTDNKNNYEQL